MNEEIVINYHNLFPNNIMDKSDTEGQFLISEYGILYWYITIHVRSI